MDEEGIVSVVAAPFGVTLMMCVTVKANALTLEKNDSFGRDVCAYLLWTGFVMWHLHYSQ